MSAPTSPELVQAFCRDYEAGMSSRQVAKKYGVSGPCVLKHLHLSGVKVRPSNRAGSRYRFNAHFFDTIDTEAKAYWLGFLAADGYVHIPAKTASPRLSLSLKYDDVKHVQSFLDAVEGNQPVYKRVGEKTTTATALIISRTLCQSLIKLGVTPRKSLTLQFPSLPEHLIRHYIRGYIDGDGSIIVRNLKTKVKGIIAVVSGSYNFLKTMQHYIQTQGGIHATKIYSKTNSNASAIHYNNRFAKQLIIYLYSDTTVYLPRKWHNARTILGYNQGTPTEVIPQFTYYCLLSTLRQWVFERDVCEKYRQGASAPDIALIHQTYKNHIYRILKRHKVKRRSREEYWPLRKQVHGPSGSVNWL